MALLNSLINESGFPGIDEQPYTSSTRIKAVYEYGAAFSLDVKFKEQSVDELGLIVDTPIVIDSFTFTPSTSTVSCIKKNDDTITISGSIGETFTDAYYNFLMQDNVVKTLPMNTTEKFKALVKWSPPATKRDDVHHVLSLTYKYTPTSVTVPVATQQTVTTQLTFDQGVYWNYSIAISQFRALVAKGTI